MNKSSTFIIKPEVEEEEGSGHFVPVLAAGHPAVPVLAADRPEVIYRQIFDFYSHT